MDIPEPRSKQEILREIRNAALSYEGAKRLRTEQWKLIIQMKREKNSAEYKRERERYYPLEEAERNAARILVKVLSEDIDIDKAIVDGILYTTNGKVLIQYKLDEIEKA